MRRFAAASLPAVVREGLVGLGHPVDVVLALPGAALLLGGVEHLVGEPLGHGLLAPRASELHEPADREGAGAAGRYLDRNLVGRTADPARADLEDRRELLDGVVEHIDG